MGSSTVLHTLKKVSRHLDNHAERMSFALHIVVYWLWNMKSFQEPTKDLTGKVFIRKVFL